MRVMDKHGSLRGRPLLLFSPTGLANFAYGDLSYLSPLRFLWQQLGCFHWVTLEPETESLHRWSIRQVTGRLPELLRTLGLLTPTQSLLSKAERRNTSTSFGSAYHVGTPNLRLITKNGIELLQPR